MGGSKVCSPRQSLDSSHGAGPDSVGNFASDPIGQDHFWHGLASLQMIPKNFFDLVYLLLAAQGAFVVGLLWTRRSNRAANRVLAVPIAALTLSSFYTFYFRVTAVTADNAGWLFTIDSFQLLYGPSFYLYAVVLTQRPRRLGRMTRHLLPFALHSLYLLPRLLLPGEQKLQLLKHIRLAGPTLEESLVQAGVELLGLVYLVAAIFVVRRYHASVAGQFSNLDRLNLRWLNGLLYALLGLWVASTFAWISSMPLLVYVHTGMAIVVYAIAYRMAFEADVVLAELSTLVASTRPAGSRPASIVDAARTTDDSAAPPVAGSNEPQMVVRARGSSPPQQGDSNTEAPPQKVVPPRSSEAETNPAAQPIERAKYRKAQLSPAKLDEIGTRLEKLFQQEQPYLDPNLTLTKLAARLEVSPHHLSQALSRRFRQSFHDFVNLARVTEMKRMLLDQSLADKKILSLGLDCGFSSKSTLNNNFKRHTGLTPSQFRAARR